MPEPEDEPLTRTVPSADWPLQFDIYEHDTETVEAALTVVAAAITAHPVTLERA